MNNNHVKNINNNYLKTGSIRSERVWSYLWAVVANRSREDIIRRRRRSNRVPLTQRPDDLEGFSRTRMSRWGKHPVRVPAQASASSSCFCRLYTIVNAANRSRRFSNTCNDPNRSRTLFQTAKFTRLSCDVRLISKKRNQRARDRANFFQPPNHLIRVLLLLNFLIFSMTPFATGTFSPKKNVKNIPVDLTGKSLSYDKLYVTSVLNIG
jgi:hypothetical protein